MSKRAEKREELADKVEAILPEDDPTARACLCFLGVLLAGDDEDALVHAAFLLQKLAEHTMGLHG